MIYLWPSSRCACVWIVGAMFVTRCLINTTKKKTTVSTNNSNESTGREVQVLGLQNHPLLHQFHQPVIHIKSRMWWCLVSFYYIEEAWTLSRAPPAGLEEKVRFFDISNKSLCIDRALYVQSNINSWRHDKKKKRLTSFLVLFSISAAKYWKWTHKLTFILKNEHRDNHSEKT